jgi:hypothetical protein
VKLTCTSAGPGNCEAAIDRELEKLLARKSGWLVFNTPHLDFDPETGASIHHLCLQHV